MVPDHLFDENAASNVSYRHVIVVFEQRYHLECVYPLQSRKFFDAYCKWRGGHTFNIRVSISIPHPSERRPLSLRVRAPNQTRWWMTPTNSMPSSYHMLPHLLAAPTLVRATCRYIIVSLFIRCSVVGSSPTRGSSVFLGKVTV